MHPSVDISVYYNILTRKVTHVLFDILTDMSVILVGRVSVDMLADCGCPIVSRNVDR